MISWLAANWGTILVCIILAAIIIAIIVKMRKDKKAGKSSCGGNCKACGGACSACRTPCEKQESSAEV